MVAGLPGSSLFSPTFSAAVSTLLAAADAKGCTPLHNAAEHGHSEAVGLLLSRGIPVDPLNHHGTPLHRAAAKGNARALKVLLDHGADPNKVIHRVFSPLMKACTSGSVECVKLLVEAGADVNFQRFPGPTMLLAAVNVGSADMVSFLLEAGADPNIHDGELFVEPISNAKSEGREAFANGEYGYAIYCFSRAHAIDPRDATLLANLSLCWLKLREGKLAVLDAQRCQRLSPRWAKAWFREGTALSMLQKYKPAVDAFEQVLKLDPANEEIKEALREAMEALSGVLASAWSEP